MFRPTRRVASQPAYAVNTNHPLCFGMVAWWLVLPNLFGGLKWFDLFGQSNGTLTAMANANNGFRGTTAQGHQGDMLFDTGNSVQRFVEIGTPKVLDISGNFSAFSVWNTTTTTIDSSLLADTNAGATAGRFWWEINHTASKQSIGWGTTLALVTGTKSISANVWNSSGVTRYGSSGSWTGELYLNGLLDTTGTTAVNPSAQTDVCIGGAHSLTNHQFAGRIASMIVWNRRLLAPEFEDLDELSKQFYPGMLIRRHRAFAVAAAGAVFSLTSTLAAGAALSDANLGTLIDTLSLAAGQSEAQADSVIGLVSSALATSTGFQEAAQQIALSALSLATSAAMSQAGQQAAVLAVLQTVGFNIQETSQQVVSELLSLGIGASLLVSDSTLLPQSLTLSLAAGAGQTQLLQQITSIALTLAVQAVLQELANTGVSTTLIQLVLEQWSQGTIVSESWSAPSIVNESWEGN